MKVDLLEGFEYAKCLNLGFVGLIDLMPRLVFEGRKCDDAVVQAARVSFGQGIKTPEEDRNLIRYLFRHNHTTPLEMVEFKFHAKLPIFVARQWIRHRTACITGDTLLHFDLPGGIERKGNQLYTLSVDQIYERFQPTENKTRPDKQKYRYHKRDQVQGMMLRCLDEETREVIHTRIVDIWISGEKEVYELSFNGNIIKASADHLFLTNQGWKTLKEVAELEPICRILPGVKFSTIGPGFNTGVKAKFNKIDPETEEWLPVVGWENWYEISNQGRIRRYGQACKTLTVCRGKAVVSLNRPGIQETKQIHQLMCEAFYGECPEGEEICHEDGNGLNNSIDNLRYGTPKSNADDRVRDKATTKLKENLITPSIRFIGREITYDIEVSGPFHNFSAGGFVVHNSVNELSGRYSILKDEFYIPTEDNVRSQSVKNKQGGDQVSNSGVQFLEYLEQKCEQDYKEYEKWLGMGISKEQSRMCLPLNLYTEWYWKIDLHNLLHFLSLRCDSHAQYEIRVFADAMLDFVKRVAPVCYEAWNDYHHLREGMKLSRLEIEALRVGIFASENKREIEEWETKRRRLGLEP